MVINVGEDTTLKARIGWQGLTTSEYRDIGEYLLVTGTDFKNGFVDWDSCHFVDKIRYSQDKNIQLKNGDVVITKDGTIGKVGYIKNLKLPATLNSGVFVIRPKKDAINTKLMYYIFTSKIFDDFLSKLTAGSTINHLYQKDFVNFEFEIPDDIDEQKNIAKALSDTDELIDSIQTLKEKKENIKTGTMQQLLTAKKRLDGFCEEWKEKTLGDIAIVIGGGTPSTTNNLFWNGHINWFTPTEIGFAKYVKKSVRKITQLGFMNSSAQILPEGTILLTSRAGIGSCSILLEKSATNQGFQSLIAKENTNNEFLYYLTKTLKNKLLEKASGSTFLEISPSNVKSIDIVIPSKKEEQKAIANILSDMDNEIETLTRKLEKTKAIKEAMMDELLTGNTRLI